MSEPPEPLEPRAQLGWALMLGGLAALIGTPIVYRIRATSAHTQPSNNWLWPTWWMLVPVVVIVVGYFIARMPASFDARRSLRRSRLFSRRRGR